MQSFKRSLVKYPSLVMDVRTSLFPYVYLSMRHNCLMNVSSFYNVLFLLLFKLFFLVCTPLYYLHLSTIIYQLLILLLAKFILIQLPALLSLYQVVFIMFLQLFFGDYS